MKLNNKGFTLIELLAVVVILLIISVIAIPSISAAIERNKAKKNEAQIDVIETYAEIYYETHINSYPGGISTFCIKVSDLDLTEAEIEDAYGKKFTGVIKYSSGEFVFKPNETC